MTDERSRPATWAEVAERVKAFGFYYPSKGENVGTLVIDLILEVERLRDEQAARAAAAQKPVAIRDNIDDLRIGELTPAEKIIAGIRWMAANEGYGIKSAAKELEAEFRLYAAHLDKIGEK